MGLHGRSALTRCGVLLCGAALSTALFSIPQGVNALDEGDPTTTTTTTTPSTTSSSTSTTSSSSTSSTSTTSTSTTTTTSIEAPSTTESASPRFTGVGFWLMQVSENQFQVRVLLSISQMPITFPAGSLTISWTVTSSGSTVATGTLPMDGTTGLIAPNPFPITEVVNLWGLRGGTDYVLSVTAGIPGNMVSGSRTITTNGSGWQTTTTAGGSGSDSDSGSDGPATSVPTDDEAPYMARIDENNVVIDTCVCVVSYVRTNPDRYPGTWVPMWMGVNGKNYAGPGWIYDRAAQNFYPPTTTTTTTTTTLPESTSSSVSATTTTVGLSAARASRSGARIDLSPTALDPQRADLTVGVRSSGSVLAVTSKFPNAKLTIRATRAGSRTLTWSLTTNSLGEIRQVTRRNLSGYTVSVWFAGARLDSEQVR